MDAAGPVDAQNAPTGPWKTAQTAVSHSAHTHRPFDRLTHEIPDTPDFIRAASGYWLGTPFSGSRVFRPHGNPALPAPTFFLVVPAVRPSRLFRPSGRL